VKRAAIIVNPVKVDDLEEVRRTLCDAMADAGWSEPIWHETTAEDTGERQARESAEAGADVVFACGGDGTVMACVTGLAGSGVPMGVLPVGTGNLLARNLDLPLDMAEAMQVGLEGDDLAVDVGTFVVGGARDEGRHFVVMAGVGFDAAMMADAPEGLKAKVGWPAYVVSGAKHLRDRGVPLGVRVDGGEPVRRRAQAVIIGNVGSLQAGVELFPDARPDDGVLDVAIMAPNGLLDWARVLGRLALRRPREDQRFERFRGRRIELKASRPMPVQLDGDPLDEARDVVVEVDPGALLVRVRAGAGAG